jgi:tetratricopeptide (TPR) repeat protein
MGFEELAQRANDCRVAGRHEEAAELFARAEDELSPDVEDRRRALLLSLQATLDRDMCRYGSALDKLTRAARLYRLHGDSDGLARCDIKRGIALDDMGEHEAAKAEFGSAWKRVPPDSDLRVMAVYNIINAEVCQGNIAQARAMFEAMRPAADLMVEQGDPLGHHLRVHWTEAEILLGEDRVEEARSILREVSSHYAATGSAIDACRALTDLAECAVRLGELPEADATALVIAGLMARIGPRESETVRKIVLARMSRRQYSEAVLKMVLLRKGPARVLRG